MSVKEWLLAKVRDDKTHAEIDARERVVNETVAGLRHERDRNGFGRLFDVATTPTPRPRHRPRRS